MAKTPSNHVHPQKQSGLTSLVFTQQQMAVSTKADPPKTAAAVSHIAHLLRYVYLRASRKTLKKNSSARCRVFWI